MAGHKLGETTYKRYTHFLIIEKQVIINNIPLYIS